MTTTDFMTSQGFEFKHGTAYYGHDTVFFPDQARLMHQTFVEGQIAELEKLSSSGHGGGNWRRLIESRTAALTSELDEIKKGSV